MSVHDRISIGDRVRCLHMGEDPDPIPAGSEGRVTYVQDLTSVLAGGYQIGVQWDSGRTLSLCEKDQWEKIA